MMELFRRVKRYISLFALSISHPATRIRNGPH
ncbi:uncharacterized protein METZ01_LOCUS21426 [marine metagenome]|uniref:Uncharacterized protein n=1 Tax=marine metagenome TaxID=408172 RepID=A0A381PNH3_9ZZZZ